MVDVEVKRKINGCGKIVIGVHMVRILKDGKPITKWEETKEDPKKYLEEWREKNECKE